MRSERLIGHLLAIRSKAIPVFPRNYLLSRVLFNKTYDSRREIMDDCVFIYKIIYSFIPWTRENSALQGRDESRPV